MQIFKQDENIDLVIHREADLDIKVFYFDKNKVINKIPREVLFEYLDGRVFASEKRQIEFCLGRFLIKNVLKNIYDVQNLKIIIKNNKPVLENGGVHFSLSHSKDIVLCAFSYMPVGADVEYMKERDFSELCARYNLSEISKDSFYDFWTKYEAQIKLQTTPVSVYTEKIFSQYLLSVCSISEINNVDIEEYCL